LIRGGELVVGRSPACDIVLDEGFVSTRHCKVQWDEDGFSVQDVGSKNGTYVNGTRVEHTHALRVGDYLQIGSTVLRLRDEVAPSRAPSVSAWQVRDSTNAARPVTKTGVVPLGALADRGATAYLRSPVSTHVGDEALDSAAELSTILEDERDTLVVVRRVARVERFAELPIVFGRERGTDVALDDDALSLRHAAIERASGGFRLRDVGSKNGTFVNGQRIVVRLLKDADVITVGRYTVLVLIVDGRLGLDVRSPDVAVGGAEPLATQPIPIGTIAPPITGKQKKKRKKASELAWFATSDLDRGVFRARSAIVSMVVGVGVTAWLLAFGDSETLAGGALASAHESAEFDAEALEIGRSSCAACHVGVGRVATLRCLECHPFNRPRDGHAGVNLACASCHPEHQGSKYNSVAAAVFGCADCHPEPHKDLPRLDPKLVIGFDRTAPADVEFHLQHMEAAVECLACHEHEAASGPRGARATCGGCHAPELVTAEDCQHCHHEHPDRTVDVNVAVAPRQPPPRFRVGGATWAFAMLVVPFLVAALLPRPRRVELDPDEA